MKNMRMIGEIKICPPFGECVICGNRADLGSIYYHCKKCGTLGHIRDDDKVHPVSGPSKIMRKYRNEQ